MVDKNSRITHISGKKRDTSADECCIFIIMYIISTKVCTYIQTVMFLCAFANVSLFRKL